MELLEKLQTLNNHLVAKNYKKVIEGCNKILKKKSQYSLCFKFMWSCSARK